MMKSSRLAKARALPTRNYNVTEHARVEEGEGVAIDRLPSMCMLLSFRLKLVLLPCAPSYGVSRSSAP